MTSQAGLGNDCMEAEGTEQNDPSSTSLGQIKLGRSEDAATTAAPPSSASEVE